MTVLERAAFAEAQIEDYAAWLIERDDATTPAAAWARARAEIESEMTAAVEAGDLFWSASDGESRTVGWLWVKRSEPGLPMDAVFLYQIQVIEGLRRQGYGRAMLAALEVELMGMSFRELRLNVWDSNTAAGHLYENSGYTLAEQLAGKRQLRKVLASAGDSRDP